jgi:hypothetical protein
MTKIIDYSFLQLSSDIPTQTRGEKEQARPGSVTIITHPEHQAIILHAFPI